MKKKFIITFLSIIYLLSCNTTEAETLQGGVEKVWTVDSAREEAFKDAKEYVDLSWASPIDPNLIENKQAINNNQEKIKNRLITTFYNGCYCVKILDENNYNKAYYYYPSGELAAIDFEKYNTSTNFQDVEQGKDLSFPIKTYKHSYPSGQIMSLGITVKENDSYVFKPSGELDVHWVGNCCYDLNGNVVAIRDLLLE